MKLQVKISDDGVVEDVKFRTFGCGSAIASSSYATTWLKGKTVDEAMALKVRAHTLSFPYSATLLRRTLTLPTALSLARSNDQPQLTSSFPFPFLLRLHCCLLLR